MPAFIVSRAVGADVLPVDRITLDRLEHYTFYLLTTIFTTFNEFTPLCSFRPSDPREMCSTSCTFASQPYHEAADSSLASTCAGPVIVISVMAAWTVALRPQLLYKDEGTPSLEGARTRFYTLYRVRTWNRCFAGVSDLGIQALFSGRPDSRRLKQRIAEPMISIHINTRSSSNRHTSTAQPHPPLSLPRNPQYTQPTALYSAHVHS